MEEQIRGKYNISQVKIKLGRKFPGKTNNLDRQNKHYCDNTSLSY